MVDGTTLPITEVYEDIFRIAIPLKGTPLGTINAYLIRGDDRSVLIDTGYRMKLCTQTIENSLQELQIDPSRMDILLTHFHNDHSGSSTSLVQPGRRIYVPAQEYRFFGIGAGPDLYTESRRALYLTEGVTEDFFDKMMSYRKPGANGPDFFSQQFSPIENTQTLSVGKYTLTAVHTPGHTPGHMCYWEEDHKILFSGDHILFDISPNIIPWAGVPNILGIYLYSLKKLQSYPAALVLPGHREPGNLSVRINELLTHHEQRLDECESLVKLYPGKTAMELTKLLSWKINRSGSAEDFPFSVLRYAFGECLVHLDYLRFRKRITRDLGQDGFYHYY